MRQSAVLNILGSEEILVLALELIWRVLSARVSAPSALRHKSMLRILKLALGIGQIPQSLVQFRIYWAAKIFLSLSWNSI